MRAHYRHSVEWLLFLIVYPYFHRVTHPPHTLACPIDCVHRVVHIAVFTLTKPLWNILVVLVVFD